MRLYQEKPVASLLGRRRPETVTGRLTFKTQRCGIEFKRLSKFFSRLENPLILGGVDFSCEQNRYSYFAAEPSEVLELGCGDMEHFAKIQSAVDKYRLDDLSCAGLPAGIFACGWAGYFSYDLGRFIEDIGQTACDDLAMPLVRLCFYDKVICFDHKNGVFLLIAADIDGQGIGADEKISILEDWLKRSADENPILSFDDTARGDGNPGGFSTNMSRDDYFDCFSRIKRYIFDGDVYQINFSQRFCFDFDASAIELYLWQNAFNPSPYSAFIDSGRFKLVSASPELFIKTDGRKILTRPIKGTRPVSGNREKDCAFRIELIESEKEKAELDMIIDLERNDFGRICRPGSIRVTRRRKIEDYATVMHAVADVEGILREDINFTDLLKAVFPGGSITGAPKVSAMQIIEQLEPTRRGLYTGCIGYISLDGNVCLNIAIRTIIITQQKAYAQAGGGIVADSDPQAEWNESLDKAKALLEGIKSVSMPRKFT